MKRVVRMGRPQDQDRWRRDDYAAMTPDERLELVMAMRDATWPDAAPIQRQVRIRRLAAP